MSNQDDKIIDKKDPGANLTLSNPNERKKGEPWHISWVYRGEGDIVRHGDNIFVIKPRLTVESLNNLKISISEQMNCATNELTITSMTRLPV